MINRRPRAIHALIETAEYIARDNSAAADRFLRAAEAAFAQLEALPGIGRPFQSDDPRLKELRIWHVKGFPKHLIFYRPLPNGIEVIHVLHGARDIGAALDRELNEGEL